MFLFSLCAASVAHVVTPDDLIRFGVERTPVVLTHSHNPVAVVWEHALAVQNQWELRRGTAGWVCGRESQLEEIIRYADWSSSAWSLLDDACRPCTSEECRGLFLLRLQRHVGMVAYYHGTDRKSVV